MWRSLCVLLLLGCVSAAPAEDTEKSGSERGNLGIFQDVKLSGDLWSSYRFRSDEADQDQDIDSYLNLRFRDIVKDQLDANVSFRLNKDIDGGRNSTSLFKDSFRDLDDVRDLDYPDELYTANVLIRDAFRSHSDIRVGRQFLSTFHGLHLDGVWVNSRKHGPFDLEAFVGRPVSFYSGIHGNKTGGGAVTYRHSRKGKARILYYRYDDGNWEDDYADLDVWYRPFTNLGTHGSLDLLENNIQRFLWSNHFYYEPSDLDLWLTYTHLFDKVKQHTIEFSPLFAPLHELDPFDRVDFRFSKGMGEQWLVYGGISARGTNDQTNGRDRANRDYQLYDLGATYSPLKKLNISLTGEYWDLDSGDRFSGVTGEVEYRPTQRWRFILGDSYAEYRDAYYDVFTLQTYHRTPDIQTYYARVRWKATDKATLSGKLTVEDDDSDESPFYTLHISMGLFF